MVSERDIIDFQDNPVWLSMQNDIITRVEMVRNDLEVVLPTDVAAMSSLQGELKSLRWLLTLPELTLLSLQEESGQEAEEPLESEDSDGN